MVAGKKRIGKKFVVSELLLTFAVLNEKNVNNNSNYLNKMTKKTKEQKEISAQTLAGKTRDLNE